MLKSFMHPSNVKPDSKPNQPPYAPTKPVESAKPAEPRVVEPAKAEAAPVAAPTEEGSKLIVGPNIKLKGSEITDCEILVVEGRVEASMKSRVIRIAEGGVFSGKAEIDVAEVRGAFEGDLTVRKRLVIYGSGKVTGTIRYGAMMVEEGGTITGDVATLAPAPGIARVGEAATSTPASATVQDSAADAGAVETIPSLVRNQMGKR